MPRLTVSAGTKNHSSFMFLWWYRSLEVHFHQPWTSFYYFFCSYLPSVNELLNFFISPPGEKFGAHTTNKAQTQILSRKSPSALFFNVDVRTKTFVGAFFSFFSLTSQFDMWNIDFYSRAAQLFQLMTLKFNLITFSWTKKPIGK